MAANKKFTPRASSNLIEEEVTTDKETTAEETAVDNVTPDTDATVAEETSEKKSKASKESASDEEKSDEVTFSAETDSKPIEERVKVHLARKFDGCIGGEWYHFNKGDVVIVPKNVKRILNGIEGMLKPL